MMKFILDTNILIRHWRRRYVRPQKKHRAKDARRWAQELIRREGTDAIVTPVYVEMVCGALTEQEARLTQAFLGPFRCVDDQDIPADDWRGAIRLAARPRGKARDLGDCLIRAILRNPGLGQFSSRCFCSSSLMPVKVSFIRNTTINSSQ
jgi:predicted nucleic acid-binding protein